jgi:hypothetical protein
MGLEPPGGHPNGSRFFAGSTYDFKAAFSASICSRENTVLL